MKNLEQLTKNQGIGLTIAYILGTTILGARKIGSYSLLSLCFAFIVFVPLIFLYSNILKNKKGNGFDIIFNALNPNLAKFISLILALYSVLCAVFTLRNYTEVLSVTSMPNTPLWFMGLFIILTACYLAKKGIKTVSKMSVVFVILGILFLITTLLLSGFDFTFDLKHSLPQAKSIVNASLLFYNPFCDCILLLFAIDNIESKKRILPFSFISSFCILLLITLRNLLLLGQKVYSICLVPSYIATSMLSFFGIIGHLEIIESVISLLFVLIKLAVCLIVIKNFIKRVKKTENFLYLSAFAIDFFSSANLGNVDNLTALNRYYTLVTIPLQILPIFLLIFTKKQLKR